MCVAQCSLYPASDATEFFLVYFAFRNTLTHKAWIQRWLPLKEIPFHARKGSWKKNCPKFKTEKPLLTLTSGARLNTSAFQGFFNGPQTTACTFKVTMLPAPKYKPQYIMVTHWQKYFASIGVGNYGTAFNIFYPPAYSSLHASLYAPTKQLYKQAVIERSIPRWKSSEEEVWNRLFVSFRKWAEKMWVR